MAPGHFRVVQSDYFERSREDYRGDPAAGYFQDCHSPIVGIPERLRETRRGAIIPSMSTAEVLTGIRLTTGQRIDWLMDERIPRRKPGELADAVGISHDALLNYRRDRRPVPGDVLRGLARELETSADFLLCLTDDPRPVAALIAVPRDSSTGRYLSGPRGGLSTRPTRSSLRLKGRRQGGAQAAAA